MEAIDILEREHTTIDAVVDVIEAIAGRLEDGYPIGTRMIAEVLDFCEHFTDRCHAAKEELALFPALEVHDLGPDVCVVSALRAQHEAGKVYVREMRSAATRLSGKDRDAARVLAASARDYVALMREHVRIERQYFYVAAHGKLSEDENTALIARFEEIDRDLSRSEDRRRYLELADRYRPLLVEWEEERQGR